MSTNCQSQNDPSDDTTALGTRDSVASSLKDMASENGKSRFNMGATQPIDVGSSPPAPPLQSAVSLTDMSLVLVKPAKRRPSGTRPPFSALVNVSESQTTIAESESESVSDSDSARESGSASCLTDDSESEQAHHPEIHHDSSALSVAWQRRHTAVFPPTEGDATHAPNVVTPRLGPHPNLPLPVEDPIDLDSLWDDMRECQRLIAESKQENAKQRADYEQESEAELEERGWGSETELKVDEEEESTRHLARHFAEEMLEDDRRTASREDESEHMDIDFEGESSMFTSSYRAFLESSPMDQDDEEERELADFL
ncbi:hypothetical protein HETIRDRAFT_459655 [Heterobasidion irregulare TC 32-1]|uniref:Uncharacterized protein n=1 Tax=Heterobasidion irregulare (strain TC 32-1) TaxID=747525 RepID=W4K1D2_HETIT|nr:uncharacterized protein HETIRDRAFT_459655 [Heterobasidion irregulare TC 32-1]ETW79638.1 hypothetical protein HETIRDRAFT_459655 [Heterobasidion irregulare TC 32-1]